MSLPLRISLAVLAALLAVAAVASWPALSGRPAQDRPAALSLARGLAAGLAADDVKSRSLARRRLRAVRRGLADVRAAAVYREGRRGGTLLAAEPPGSAVARPAQVEAALERRRPSVEGPAGLTSVVVPLPQRGSTGSRALGVVIAAPPAAATSPWRALLPPAALSLALAALALITLRRTLSRPLRALRARAAALHAGPDAPRLDWRRRDELGDLARELDKAAGALGRRQRELEALALRDPVTGLLASEAFADRLAGELRRGRREGYRVTVAALEPDGLADLDDGWSAAEPALALVAERVQNELRPSDLCGRLERGRVVLALPGTGGVDGEDVIERVRAAVASIEFLPTGEAISLSAGIAQFPFDAVDPDELVAMALSALETSTSRGHNLSTTYSEESAPQYELPPER